MFRTLHHRVSSSPSPSVISMTNLIIFLCNRSHSKRFDIELMFHDFHRLLITGRYLTLPNGLRRMHCCWPLQTSTSKFHILSVAYILGVKRNWKNSCTLFSLLKLLPQLEYRNASLFMGLAAQGKPNSVVNLLRTIVNSMSMLEATDLAMQTAADHESQFLGSLPH